MPGLGSMANLPKQSNIYHNILLLSADVPSIVFIHGLGGHPQNTWSAKYAQTTETADRRPSDTSNSSTSRKSSLMFGKFLKRSKTGAPLGLGDRSMSVAPSILSTDTGTESVSPGEILADPLSNEPESLVTPETPSPSKSKVYWPRDLLPKDFPNVRVFLSSTV